MDDIAQKKFIAQFLATLRGCYPVFKPSAEEWKRTLKIYGPQLMEYHQTTLKRGLLQVFEAHRDFFPSLPQLKALLSPLDAKVRDQELRTNRLTGAKALLEGTKGESGCGLEGVLERECLAAGQSLGGDWSPEAKQKIFSLCVLLAEAYGSRREVALEDSAVAYWADTFQRFGIPPMEAANMVLGIWRKFGKGPTVGMVESYVQGEAIDMVWPKEWLRGYKPPPPREPNEYDLFSAELEKENEYYKNSPEERKKIDPNPERFKKLFALMDKKPLTKSF